MHPQKSIGLRAAFLGVFLIASACTEEGNTPLPAAPASNAAVNTAAPASSSLPTQLAKAILAADEPFPGVPETLADDECCSEVGQANECWLEDAADDGIICPTNDAAPVGSPSCLNTSLGCDSSGRVCECASNADCYDGDARLGMCIINVGETTGLCGPSYCNGYKICSCWGGCIAADVTTPEENCDAAGYECCDGTYPIMPATEGADVGSGFCSDDGSCGGGCTLDSQCPDDDNPCTDPHCDLATGICGFEDNTSPCNADSDGCTVNDVCSDGDCVEGSAPNCDDSNLCTTDSCSSTGINSYSCVNNNNTLPCNADSNGCTANDTCSGGACVAGAAPNCEDGNVCTNNACVNTGTSANNWNTHTCSSANNTLACNKDSDGCTVDDVCSAGTCVAGATANCSDTNVCTDDSCTSTGLNSHSCNHNNNTASCDDGLWCTENDKCSGGSCTNTTARNCGTNTTCTTYSCNESTDHCDTNYTTSACDDSLWCNGADTCSGGTCSQHAGRSCSDSAVCTTDSCNETTDACVNTAISGCCTADSQCTAACPASANTTCNLEYCDATSHTCVCDPTYGADNSLSCALDTNVYPENCYVGYCAADGDCDPDEIENSGSDLCRTMFVTGNINTLDTNKPSYLGSFVNTDNLGHLPGGGTASRLESSGSTECGNDNYEATGKMCKEEGAGSLSGINLGSSGKDAVYVFEYQVNSAAQYQLYSYQIEVQANFNVGVYLKTDIENADQCPEGVNVSPTGQYTVASSRCYVAYSAAKAVLEDRCMDGNSTYSPSQTCCNPLAGESTAVNCDGTSSGSTKGYYWCKRYYPAGCCGYARNENCAAKVGTTCAGYWSYPADPFDSTCTVDNASFPTSNLATATVYPDGATDGTTRKVFIFVDGVNYAAGGGGVEGDFYITVKKIPWRASPCDRTNDDMRLFDVTHAGYTGSTYTGTLANTPNSTHNGSGSCGGYSCANSWSGSTSCHASGSENEFWPNKEALKIDRAPGTGDQTYCIKTDESFAGAADLVLSVEEVDPSDTSICSATISDVGCAVDYWDDGAVSSVVSSGGNIAAEFTAHEGVTYNIGLSNYNKLDRPCGAQSTYGCLYKVIVSEGPCPPACDGAPLGEASKGTITIANPSYGSIVNTGVIDTGDGDNYGCGGYDESWVLNNTTSSAVTVTISMAPVYPTLDAELGLYDCANDRIGSCVDSPGASAVEKIIATILPGQNYYISAEGYSSTRGSYTLTVTWGTAPAACKLPSAWTVPFSGALAGTVAWTGAATWINGNSNTAPPYAGTNYYNFSDGYDEMWAVTVAADASVRFSGCNDDGGDANFDSVFALYDCTGTMVASSDDDCGGFLSFELNSWISANLKAARSPYYLLVDAYDPGEGGSYSIRVY